MLNTTQNSDSNPCCSAATEEGSWTIIKGDKIKKKSVVLCEQLTQGKMSIYYSLWYTMHWIFGILLAQT